MLHNDYWNNQANRYDKICLPHEMNDTPSLMIKVFTQRSQVGDFLVGHAKEQHNNSVLILYSAFI